MKPMLITVVGVSAAVLLFFVFHDVISLGMDVSSSAWAAPEQLWDALKDAVSWRVEYKAGATIILIFGLGGLYVLGRPTTKPQ